MIVDDTLLLSYADNTLPPDQIERVGNVIRDDADLAQRLAFLQASRLNYQEAFECQALPAIPRHLFDAVQASCEAARDAGLNQAGNTQASNKQVTNPPARNGGRTSPVNEIRVRNARGWPFSWSKWVAPFAAGALTCALALYFVPISDWTGMVDSSGTGRATTLSSAPSALASERWIKAAAGYQKLFGRETLVDADITPASMTRTLAAIHDEDKLALQIPDLKRVGLTLKAVQRLRYHGEPLLQLVYLPKTGGPVALCVMKEAAGGKPEDAKPAAMTADGMEVLTWKKDDLRYALIAAPGDANLPSLLHDVEAMTPS